MDYRKSEWRKEKEKKAGVMCEVISLVFCLLAVSYFVGHLLIYLNK